MRLKFGNVEKRSTNKEESGRSEDEYLIKRINKDAIGCCC